MRQVRLAAAYLRVDASGTALIGNLEPVGLNSAEIEMHNALMSQVDKLSRAQHC